ncbi:hypothetical protein AB0M79_35660 [Polymorphospora sp. NPDC051019]|uniref:DUF6197 family protein n=1 Tax=Polymorphospora sp. NPDC051019 TaxID=3155725 RepID=UPI003423553C
MKATHQPPTRDITPAELLRNAAVYLDRHGWHQGFLLDLDADTPYPPACAMGAIRMAATGNADDVTTATIPADDYTACLIAQAILANHLEPDYDHTTDIEADLNFEVISDWNDDTERARDDVTTALRDAADIWDRQHPAGGGNA